MRLLALAALLRLAAPAAAVEVSLEENRAERGSIGFVDLKAVFRRYPETEKARQNFEEVVRQAEEAVNTRKAELIGLRAELARLRVERDFLSKTPAAPAPAVSPSTAAAGPVLPGAVDPSTAQGLAPAEAALAEMDRVLADKERVLEGKESGFKTYQAQAERNILELESRRSEALLGKIYTAVVAVAREEGIGVVIDKAQILFGHKAVDLTEKVLVKLKEP